MFLGACHAYGSLFTNSSLGLSSASLTHMIKMSEPLVTSILMMTMGKISFSFDLLFTILTIIITALGSEAPSTFTSSLSGVILALGSNLCLALRNTGLKYFYTGENDRDKTKTTKEGFAMMSLAGFFSLLPLWLFLTITSEIPLNTSKSFFAACLSHAAYNIISITCVLSVFDPLQHVLLNVVKRVSIVLVFYLLIQRIPSPLNIISGIACLVVSCIIGTKVIIETQIKIP